MRLRGRVVDGSELRATIPRNEGWWPIQSDGSRLLTDVSSANKTETVEVSPLANATRPIEVVATPEENTIPQNTTVSSSPENKPLDSPVGMNETTPTKTDPTPPDGPEIAAPEPQVQSPNEPTTTEGLSTNTTTVEAGFVKNETTQKPEEESPDPSVEGKSENTTATEGAQSPGENLNRPTSPPKFDPMDGKLFDKVGNTDAQQEESNEVSVGVECGKGLFSKLSCRAAVSIHNHPLIYGFLLLVFFYFCYRRCRARCCRRRDERGEYRAVAAQYGDMLFEDTFDDDFSESYGENMSAGSFGYDEEDDWSKGPKQGIEMSSIRKEVNGGLTLEEMNG